MGQQNLPPSKVPDAFSLTVKSREPASSEGIQTRSHLLTSTSPKQAESLMPWERLERSRPSLGHGAKAQSTRGWAFAGLETSIRLGSRTSTFTKSRSRTWRSWNQPSLCPFGCQRTGDGRRRGRPRTTWSSTSEIGRTSGHGWPYFCLTNMRVATSSPRCVSPQPAHVVSHGLGAIGNEYFLACTPPSDMANA